jgi:hypothetical protein
MEAREQNCRANGTHRPPCPCVDAKLRRIVGAARELISDLEARGPLFIGDAAAKVDALKEVLR